MRLPYSHKITLDRWETTSKAVNSCSLTEKFLSKVVTRTTSVIEILKLHFHCILRSE